MSEIRIATCGTSLTRQSGAPNFWQKQVELGLRAGKETIARIFNFGEDGADSNIGLGFLSRALIVRPEIVLIEYNMNNAYVARSITVDQARANTQNMMDQLFANDAGVKIGLMTMNPPVAGGSIPLSERPNHAAYDQMYRDTVAADSRLFLVDNALAWADATVAQIPDGVHPTTAAVLARSVPIMIAALRAQIE